MVHLNILSVGETCGPTNLGQQWSILHTGRYYWAATGCRHQPCWLLAPETGTSYSPSDRTPGNEDTKTLAPCTFSTYNFRLGWCFFISTHPVGPLADSLDVGLVPLSRHAIDDLTVIHKVTGDVSASDESWLFPGQHHGVAHALQDGDAIGWSGRGWDANRKLIRQNLGVKTDVMGNWSATKDLILFNSHTSFFPVKSFSVPLLETVYSRNSPAVTLLTMLKITG